MDITKAKALRIMANQRRWFKLRKVELDDQDRQLRSDMLDGIAGLKADSRAESLDFWIDNLHLASNVIPNVIRPGEAIDKFGDIDSKPLLIAFYSAYKTYRDAYVAAHPENELRPKWAKWALTGPDADLVLDTEKPQEVPR